MLNNSRVHVYGQILALAFLLQVNGSLIMLCRYKTINAIKIQTQNIGVLNPQSQRLRFAARIQDKRHPNAVNDTLTLHLLFLHIVQT